MDDRRKIRALAIDDEEGDRTTFHRLNRYGLLCTAIPPPKPDHFPLEIFERIERDGIDVVLLDFRLDDRAPSDEQPVSYRGGMLAAAIKEKLQIPIVLVTTEEKRREYVADNPRIRNLFDYTLLKSQIGGQKNERELAGAQIVDLAIGFRRIRAELESAGSTREVSQAICQLLDIDNEELGSLEGCLQATVPTKIAEFASWLLQGLLDNPGPLLADDEASARLGLTNRTFAEKKVQEWASRARYKGVFGDLHHRWWEGRLLAQLQTARDEREGERGTRAAAIARDCGESRLQAAQCTWCNKGLVQRACYVCKKGVDATHHLVARVDDRPTWALPAVVCFRCIQRGRDEEFSSIHYRPGSGHLIAELKGTE